MTLPALSLSNTSTDVSANHNDVNDVTSADYNHNNVNTQVATATVITSATTVNKHNCK